MERQGTSLYRYSSSLLIEVYAILMWHCLNQVEPKNISSLGWSKQFGGRIVQLGRKYKYPYEH
jgi:hypothetical protein